jgi:hypothetical protein
MAGPLRSDDVESGQARFEEVARMPNLEERVAMLEGRVEEQAMVMADVRAVGREIHVSMRDVRDELTRQLTLFREEMHRRFEQVDQRFEQVDQRFEQVDQRFEQMDQRFEQVDRRFEQMDRRLEQIDRRFEQTDVRTDGRFAAVERRFEAVDRRFDRMERYFAWVTGLLVTGFVAVIGAVASAFWGVLQVIR